MTGGADTLWYESRHSLSRLSPLNNLCISQGPSLIHVTPLLSNEEAKASMQPAVDFATAHNGTVTIEELPSYLAFFTKYVTSVEAVRLPFLRLFSFLSQAGTDY